MKLNDGMSLVFKSKRINTRENFHTKEDKFCDNDGLFFFLKGIYNDDGLFHFITLHYDQIISNTVTGSGLHNGDSNNLPILHTTSAGPGRTYSATCITKSILGAKLENSKA